MNNPLFKKLVAVCCLVALALVWTVQFSQPECGLSTFSSGGFDFAIRRGNGLHERTSHTQTDAIPVVQIYSGKCQQYVRASLAQSLRYNDHVILIASSECEWLRRALPELEFHPLDEFQYLIDQLSKIFPQDHERRDYQIDCFARWFILRDFMAKHDIREVFYQDSDTLIYANVTSLRVAYGSEPLILAALPPYVSGHFSYVSHIGLDDFTNFVLHLFKDEVFKGEKKSVDFSDMAAFVLYGFAHRTDEDQECWGVDMPRGQCWDHPNLKLKSRVKTFARYPIGYLAVPACGYVFDNKIDNDEEQVYDRDDQYFKVVTFIHGVPYFNRRDYHGYVRAAGIHFQGGWKLLMKYWDHDPWFTRGACVCVSKRCCTCMRIDVPHIALDESCPVPTNPRSVKQINNLADAEEPFPVEHPCENLVRKQKRDMAKRRPKSGPTFEPKKKKAEGEAAGLWDPTRVGTEADANDDWANWMNDTPDLPASTSSSSSSRKRNGESESSHGVAVGEQIGQDFSMTTSSDEPIVLPPPEELHVKPEEIEMNVPDASGTVGADVVRVPFGGDEEPERSNAAPVEEPPQSLVGEKPKREKVASSGMKGSGDERGGKLGAEDLKKGRRKEGEEEEVGRVGRTEVVRAVTGLGNNQRRWHRGN
eukprot:CAMPEP_0184372428 /NCGR_PEP_ID=MMETSP1089-20130417/163937_1 /TAXON_ID=38269 ORGANISM="Gloeochaete wittrockiana, Strain SAG46.84" /NCGR_SAMPLE_ID=MMETSP1089 /ASSEMBLY_ACC=CAM_ASM_000445 /LENGTH=646 /DNA_ID=CAMNT_0026715273 /DNA_START=85 /DNA_END=2025 /DNA_ORIENTATION=+